MDEPCPAEACNYDMSGNYEVSKGTNSGGGGDHNEIPKWMHDRGVEYRDETTGAVLPPELVRTAIDEAIKYMVGLEVYTLVTL